MSTTTTTETLWIGNEPNPDDRLKIDVSKTDRARIPPSGGNVGAEVTVTDLRTNKRLTIRRAECGAKGCVCALELVRWLPDESNESANVPEQATARLPRLDFHIAENAPKPACLLIEEESGLVVAEFPNSQSGIDHCTQVITAVNAHEQLVEALRAARITIRDMAEQQAMEDRFYVRVLAQIDAALGAVKSR